MLILCFFLLPFVFQVLLNRLRVAATIGPLAPPDAAFISSDLDTNAVDILGNTAAASQGTDLSTLQILKDDTSAHQVPPFPLVVQEVLSNCDAGRNTAAYIFNSFANTETSSEPTGFCRTLQHFETKTQGFLKCLCFKLRVPVTFVDKLSVLMIESVTDSPNVLNVTDPPDFVVTLFKVIVQASSQQEMVDAVTFCLKNIGRQAESAIRRITDKAAKGFVGASTTLVKSVTEQLEAYVEHGLTVSQNASYEISYFMNVSQLLPFPSARFITRKKRIEKQVADHQASVQLSVHHSPLRRLWAQNTPCSTCLDQVASVAHRKLLQYSEVANGFKNLKPMVVPWSTALWKFLEAKDDCSGLTTILELTISFNKEELHKQRTVSTVTSRKVDGGHPFQTARNCFAKIHNWLYNPEVNTLRALLVACTQTGDIVLTYPFRSCAHPYYVSNLGVVTDVTNYRKSPTHTSHELSVQTALLWGSAFTSQPDYKQFYSEVLTTIARHTMYLVNKVLGTVYCNGHIDVPHYEQGKEQDSCVECEQLIDQYSDVKAFICDCCQSDMCLHCIEKTMLRGCRPSKAARQRIEDVLNVSNVPFFCSKCIAADPRRPNVQCAVLTSLNGEHSTTLADVVKEHGPALAKRQSELAKAWTCDQHQNFNYLLHNHIVSTVSESKTKTQLKALNTAVAKWKQDTTPALFAHIYSIVQQLGLYTEGAEHYCDFCGVPATVSDEHYCCCLDCHNDVLTIKTAVTFVAQAEAAITLKMKRKDPISTTPATSIDLKSKQHKDFTTLQFIHDNINSSSDLDSDRKPRFDLHIYGVGINLPLHATPLTTAVKRGLVDKFLRLQPVHGQIVPNSKPVSTALKHAEPTKQPAPQPQPESDADFPNFNLWQQNQYEEVSHQQDDQALSPAQASNEQEDLLAEPTLSPHQVDNTVTAATPTHAKRGAQCLEPDISAKRPKFHDEHAHDMPIRTYADASPDTLAKQVLPDLVNTTEVTQPRQMVTSPGTLTAAHALQTLADTITVQPHNSEIQLQVEDRQENMSLLRSTYFPGSSILPNDHNSSVTEAINREQAQIDVCDDVMEHDTDCDLHGDCKPCCDLGNCTTKDGRADLGRYVMTPGAGIKCVFCDARANILKVLIPDLVLQVRQWQIPKHPRPGKLRRIQLRAEHESRKQALAHAWAHENARNYLERQDIAWCRANLSFV